MISDFLGDRPVTSHDINQLLTAVSTESLYIKAAEYRCQIRMGKTQFNYLKKTGRFDAGTHPATLGSRRIRIHKFFNMHSQKIELPEEEKIDQLTAPMKARRKNGL